MTEHSKLPPDLHKVARGIRHHLATNLVSRAIGRDPKQDAVIFAEIPDWQLRQWLHIVEGAE